MIDHIIEGMIEEELEAVYLRQEKLSERYEKGRIGMVPKFRVFEKERKIMCEVEELVFKENGDLRQVSYYWEDYGEYLTTTSHAELILMQSTGLTDKNGTEIFEGDVVKFDARSHYHPEVYAWEYETEGVGIIRYEMGSYVLEGREEAHILDSLFGMLMNYEEIEMEVIGNVYEDS